MADQPVADASIIRGQRRRAVLASTVGTTIEWYDFFLYGTTAALVFPKLFFPGSSAFAGILLSFGTQFVGFAARPIGAAIFGHFGDRIGRKATLVTTLMIMGIGTFLIGVLPGYGSIGIAAPLLLTIMRLAQGIGVGGEWGGSVLMSMEWGETKRRGLMASWPQLGVPIGLLLSTFVFQIFSSGDAFMTWGWRVPFLISAILVAIGLYIRLRVLESPAFAAVKREGKVLRQPFFEALKRHPKEVILTALVRVSEQAPFYLFITFVLTYGTEHLKMEKSPLLVSTMVAAAIGLITVPVAGHLSDKYGRKLIYAIGAVATGLFAFPYFGLLNTTSIALVAIAIIVSLFFHDLQYGPQAALIAESFGTDVRYSGAGVGYQLASVVAGGPAPLIAAAILEGSGSSTWISVYIIGCAIVTLIALALLPKRRAAEDSTYDQAAEKGEVVLLKDDPAAPAT